ncbi:MAG: aminotransferase class V-fold PLP-dependent enzyme [Symbiobacteriaceae bacterium]|nr:aminotransferase class V-fold PLP-dependent enzyme [Symbiobacteriaceae bacterium]
MPYDFNRLRQEEWPVLETMTFLDSACVSFAPQRTVRALKEFADFSARQDEISSSAHHVAMDSMREKAYREAARLLNAELEEIALVESTTHGLNIAATSIPLNPGENIVITNLEFIQVALPWTTMAKKKDIAIRVLKTEDNRFHVEDFANICDAQTRLIVISSVEWCNGWLMDLKGLGEFCKAQGIFLVLDAVQHLGVLNIDVKEFHCDFLCAGAHKWLNSPFGTGLLYINRETQKGLDSAYAGYLSCLPPEEGWGDYWENPAQPAAKSWEFLDSARRFEIGGTANYCGAIALGEVLALINEVGITNIQQQVWALTEYAMDELEKIGATLITHRDKEHRSGIVIARLYQDLEVEKRILHALWARRVYVALRFTEYVGGFRISCHYANNEQDIDSLVSALKEIIAEIGYTPDYHQAK